MIRCLSRCVLLAVACSAATAAVAQPGMFPVTEAHKQMAREAGVWSADVKLWMGPDADPVSSKGQEKNEMLGDYWLVSTFTGETVGQKFTGKSLLGYDPQSKKFVGTWCDTMTPYMTKMEGDYDVQKHALTLIGEGRDPATGEISKSKMVTTYIDENTKKFEMFGPAPGADGQWWKMLEISYKRTTDK